jgi:hypothetical protein
LSSRGANKASITPMIATIAPTAASRLRAPGRISDRDAEKKIASRRARAAV